MSDQAAATHPPDQPQREAALDLNTSAMVMAPAGSGKTDLLTLRALACLATCRRPEEVLGLTFTNKATAEMKARVVDSLRQARHDPEPEAEHERQRWRLARAVLERDDERGWALATNPSRLRFLTIDSLNATLAAQLPVLSGLGGTSRIEEHPQLLYEAAVRELIEDIDNPQTDPDLREALERVLAHAGNRVERLVPQLTSLLACRDQWGQAIAAGDSLGMEYALRGVIVQHLHYAAEMMSACNGDALIAALADGADNEPLDAVAGHRALPAPEVEALETWKALAEALLTRDGKLKARVTVRDGCPPKADHTETVKAWLKHAHDAGQAPAIAAALAGVRDLPSAHYPAEAAAFLEPLSLVLLHLMGRLRLQFEHSGRVDFVEVALRALQSLGGAESVSDVLMRLDYQIRHILVDEMQDTSLAQIRLLERITDAWTSDDGRTLFFVGDPQQSIYLFRQAEVRLFLQIWEQRRFNQIPLRCLRLTTNFRSEPTLVDWTNNALSQVFPARTDLHTGAVTFAASQAFREPGDGDVHIHPAIGRDDAHEAARVAELVTNEIHADPEQTVTVLVRARSHLRAIIPALKAQGIRYTATEIDPLTDRTAVRDVIHLIRALRHPADRQAWIGLLRARFVGLSWADTLAVARAAGRRGSILEGITRVLGTAAASADGHERLRRLNGALTDLRETPAHAGSLPRLVRGVWLALGGHEVVSEAERTDLETLFTKLDEHCPSGAVENMSAFLVALDGLFATPEPSNVELMTIHRAKGLEFDTVILPGLDRSTQNGATGVMRFRPLPEGFVIAPAPPRGGAPDSAMRQLFRAVGQLQDEARANERLRLLYVALTRAKQRMHLLGAATTNHHGDTYAPAGSLLNDLWPALAQPFVERAMALDEHGGEDGDDAPATAATAARTPSTPCIQRRVLEEPVQIPEPVFLPPRVRRALPSELTGHTTAAAAAGDRGADAIDRAVGTVYHALIERIAHDGAQIWPVQSLQHLGGAIDARLRHHGVAAQHVRRARDRVLRLATATLRCAPGQWMLTHPRRHPEMELAGYLDGTGRHAVVDLVLEDDERVHVIDHKSAGEGLDAGDADTWVQGQLDHYRPQLADYQRLLNARGDHRPVHSYLFFPALQRLDPVAITPC